MNTNNHETNPIDHFSPEATAVYTAHNLARSALAAIGAEVALTGARLPLGIPTHNYANAVRNTTNMYVAGYRNSGRPDEEIGQLLLPRIGDEHRLYTAAELTLIQASPDCSPELEKYLLYRYKIDRTTIDGHTAQSMDLSLDEAVESSVARLGAVIMTHLHDCIR